MGSVVFGCRQVNLLNNYFFFIVRSGTEQIANGVGNERASPELHCSFYAHPVYRNNMNTVGNGMASLDGLPCGELFGVCFFILMQCPADGGGVEQYFSTLQSGEAGSFG